MFLCLSWELSRWAILKQWGNKNQEKMVRQEILKKIYAETKCVLYLKWRFRVRGCWACPSHKAALCQHPLHSLSSHWWMLSGARTATCPPVFSETNGKCRSQCMCWAHLLCYTGRRNVMQHWTHVGRSFLLSSPPHCWHANGLKGRSHELEELKHWL